MNILLIRPVQNSPSIVACYQCCSMRAINCIFWSGLSPPKTYLEWSNVPNIITIPFFFSSMYAYKVFMCMWYILCGKPKPPGAELFLLEPGLNFKRLAPAPSGETNFVDEVETIFENAWAYDKGIRWVRWDKNLITRPLTLKIFNPKPTQIENLFLSPK